MKLKVIVHEAEEGGYGRKYPQFPVVLRRRKVTTNCSRIFTKQSSDACPSTSGTSRYRKRTRCWRSLFEIRSRERSRAASRKTWVGVEAYKRCHHIYAKPGNPARISLPIHGNQILKTGLLRHLLKLSGIGEDEL